MAIERNLPFVICVKPRQQTDQRCFTASRMTDERSHASCRNGKADVIENGLFALVVAKTHVPELNVALDPFNGETAVVLLRVNIQHLENTVGSRDSFLYLGLNTSE